jgi:cyclic-di-GMP-binding biofilm dispersal mediator protein
MTDFSDKNVLVLGGSRGIGAAIVRRFAKGGGKVAFTYAGSRDAASALATDVGAEAIQADSADRDAVIAVVKSRGRSTPTRSTT